MYYICIYGIYGSLYNINIIYLLKCSNIWSIISKNKYFIINYIYKYIYNTNKNNNDIIPI